jgi:hypothetical protein
MQTQAPYGSYFGNIQTQSSYGFYFGNIQTQSSYEEIFQSQIYMGTLFSTMCESLWDILTV